VPGGARPLEAEGRSRGDLRRKGYAELLLYPDREIQTLEEMHEGQAPIGEPLGRCEQDGDKRMS
jgi:hypothetical protein